MKDATKKNSPDCDLTFIPFIDHKLNSGLKEYTVAVQETWKGEKGGVKKVLPAIGERGFFF